MECSGVSYDGVMVGEVGGISEGAGLAVAGVLSVRLVFLYFVLWQIHEVMACVIVVRVLLLLGVNTHIFTEELPVTECDSS